MSFKLSYYPRLCALIALTITSCLPANQVGPRPATNPATVVEAYLQKYQPGPLPRLFQTTYLYDRNGTLLAEFFPEGRRTWVSLSAVSPDLIHATVATEDASFYSNGGIDLRRIVGAVLQNSGAQGVVSGASTITMQLARNLFLGPDQRYDKSFDRKIQEAGIAQELTGLYTKDEILEMYLNLLNYGSFTYGPEVAAQVYFGKSAADLTLPEAALLAGIPQRPADLDPFTNLAGAKQRQRVVLDLMVRHGYLTADQADAASATPLALNTAAPAGDPVNRAPHFAQYVLDTLGTRLGQDYVRRGGLRIVTTLDLNLQARAQQVVTEQVAALQPQYDLNNAALVALKPGTAEILAMVGSADFHNDAIAGQVNVATSRRQPGSALKPLLYATALDDNLVSPATVLWDLPVQYPQPNGDVYQPHNYDGRFHGPVTVRTALANSYNVPAVKLLAAYGVAPMVDRLRRFGISTLDQDNTWYGLSLALGGSEVTLLDLTTAYHAFANKGHYLHAQSVRTLVDGQGQAAATDLAPGGTPVVSPAAAFMVSDILSDNAARIPMFGAESPLVLSQPAAVKTGTTNDLRDNWTVGYTRFLVAGVWTGNSDGHPMRGATGISGAAPIWHAFMEAVLADPALLTALDVPVGESAGSAAWQFQPPPGMQQIDQCPPSLTCRSGGEYFTQSWLQHMGGEPLHDSVTHGVFAGVYAEEGDRRRQIGYCGSPAPAAASPTDSLLMLPAGPSTVQPADVPVTAQLQQEQAAVLAWSLDSAVPLYLGICEGIDQRVATFLPGESQGDQRIFVDLAAVSVP